MTSLTDGQQPPRFGELQALESAERESLAAVERLEAAESARRELRGARAWLARPSGAVKPGGVIASALTRNANRDVYSLDELVVGVRGALEQSSLAADRQRIAERETRERAAEQRLAQTRQMSERAVR